MWRRVNACPTILPWNLQNQGIDAIMQNEDAKFVDIVDALLKAWEIFLSYISASGEVGNELLEWIQRRTLGVVLQVEWANAAAAARLHLHQLAAQVVTLLSKDGGSGDGFRDHGMTGHDKEVLAAFTVLRDIIDEPWRQHIKDIMSGQRKQVDDVVLEVCRQELGIVLQMRISQLIAYKFDDMALKLVEIIMKCINDDRWEDRKEDIFSNTTSYFADVYVALLYKFKREQDIISYLKQLSSEDGLHFIERQLSKDVTTRPWKSSIKIARLGAQFFLSTALLKPKSVTSPHFLDKLTALWANMCDHDSTIYTALPSMIRKMVLFVESAANVYELSRALLEQFGDTVKAFCVELFVRALSLDLNELEDAKQKRDCPATSAANTTTAATVVLETSALRVPGDVTDVTDVTDEHTTPIDSDDASANTTGLAAHEVAAATVTALELRLAEQLEQLATLMRARAPTAWRECLLTAFCLCPSSGRLAALVVAAGEVANRKSGIRPTDPGQITHREDRRAQKRLQSTSKRRGQWPTGWRYRDETNGTDGVDTIPRCEDEDPQKHKKNVVKEEVQRYGNDNENAETTGAHRNQNTEYSIALQCESHLGSSSERECERGTGKDDRVIPQKSREVWKTWEEEEVESNGVIVDVKRRALTKEVFNEVSCQEFENCTGGARDEFEDVNEVVEEGTYSEIGMGRYLEEKSRMTVKIDPKKKYQYRSCRTTSKLMDESAYERGHTNEEKKKKQKYETSENKIVGSHTQKTQKNNDKNENRGTRQGTECDLGDDEDTVSEQDLESDTLSNASDEDITQESPLLDDVGWKDTFGKIWYELPRVMTGRNWAKRTDESGSHPRIESQRGNQSDERCPPERDEPRGKIWHLPQPSKEGSHLGEGFITRDSGRCNQVELSTMSVCNGPWRFKQEVLLKETHQENMRYENSNQSRSQESNNKVENKIKNCDGYRYNSNATEDFEKSTNLVATMRDEVNDPNASLPYESQIKDIHGKCSMSDLSVLSKNAMEIKSGSNFGAAKKTLKNWSITENTKPRIKNLDKKNEIVPQKTKKSASCKFRMEVNQSGDKEKETRGNDSPMLRSLLENENTRKPDESQWERCLNFYETIRNKMKEESKEKHVENDEAVTSQNEPRTRPGSRKANSNGAGILKENSYQKGITKTSNIKPYESITKSSINSDTTRSKLNTNLVCYCCDSTDSSDVKCDQSQSPRFENSVPNLFCDLEEDPQTVEDHPAEVKLLRDMRGDCNYSQDNVSSSREIESDCPPKQINADQDYREEEDPLGDCHSKGMGKFSCGSNNAGGDLVARRELQPEEEPGRSCRRDGVAEDALFEPQGLRADAAALGLPAALCDDLLVLLSCHRYRALSWSLGWRDLLARCVAYLRGGHNARSRRQELRYLKPQFALPSQTAGNALPTTGVPHDDDECQRSNNDLEGGRRDEVLDSTTSKGINFRSFNDVLTTEEEKRSRRFRAKRKSSAVEDFVSNDDALFDEVEEISSNSNHKSKRRRGEQTTWTCTQITDSNSENRNSLKIKLEKTRPSTNDHEISKEIPISNEDLMRNFNFNAYVQLERIDISSYINETDVDCQENENNSEIPKGDEKDVEKVEENNEQVEKLQDSREEDKKGDDQIPNSKDDTVKSKDDGVHDEDSGLSDESVACSQNGDERTNSCGSGSLPKSDDEQDTETNELESTPGSPDSEATLSAAEENYWAVANCVMADQLPDSLECQQHSTIEFPSEVPQVDLTQKTTGSDEDIYESSGFEGPVSYMVNSVGTEPHRKANVWTRIEIPTSETEIISQTTESQPLRYPDAHLMTEFVPIVDIDPTKDDFNSRMALQDTQAYGNESESISPTTDNARYSTLKLDGNPLRILESTGDFVTIVSVVPLETETHGAESSLDSSCVIPASSNVIGSPNVTSRKPCDVSQMGGNQDVRVVIGGNMKSSDVGTLDNSFMENRMENHSSLQSYAISSALPANYSTNSECYPNYVYENNTNNLPQLPKDDYSHFNWSPTDTEFSRTFTDINNIHKVGDGRNNFSDTENILVDVNEASSYHLLPTMENKISSSPITNFNRTSFSSSEGVDNGSVYLLNESRGSFYDEGLTNGETLNSIPVRPSMAIRTANYSDSSKLNIAVPTMNKIITPVKKSETFIPFNHTQRFSNNLGLPNGSVNTVSRSSMNVPTNKLIRQTVIPGKYCGKKILLTKRCFPAMSGIYNINNNGTLMERQVKPVGSVGNAHISEVSTSFDPDGMKINTVSNGSSNTLSLAHRGNTTCENNVRLIAKSTVDKCKLKPFSCIVPPTSTPTTIYNVFGGHLHRNNDLQGRTLPTTYPIYDSNSDQSYSRKLLNIKIASDSKVYNGNKKPIEVHSLPPAFNTHVCNTSLYLSTPPAQEKFDNCKQQTKCSKSSRLESEKMISNGIPALDTKNNFKKIQNRNKEVPANSLVSSTENPLLTGVPTLLTTDSMSEKTSLPDARAGAVVETSAPNTQKPRTINCNARRQRRRHKIKGTVKRVRMCF